jgi:UDP-perosamine 4-acetyltransferase
MPRIVVLGANAAARIVAYNLSYDKTTEVVGYTDPDSSKWGTTLLDKTILGSDDILPKLFAEGVSHAVIAAGDPHLRRKLRERVTAIGFELANAIHPSAVISPGVVLGKGVVVLAGSVLSDNPVIEDNVWVGLAATITHDTRIGRDSLIGGRSAIGAEVDVGERTVVGWGCVVGPRRRIGSDAAVGFGSNVVRDIPDRAVAVGNPAQVIKYRD